jgi:hypothetical protein
MPVTLPNMENPEARKALQEYYDSLLKDYIEKLM